VRWNRNRKSRKRCIVMSPEVNHFLMNWRTISITGGACTTKTQINIKTPKVIIIQKVTIIILWVTVSLRIMGQKATHLRLNSSNRHFQGMISWNKNWNSNSLKANYSQKWLGETIIRPTSQQSMNASKDSGWLITARAIYLIFKTIKFANWKNVLGHLMMMVLVQSVLKSCKNPWSA